MATTNTTFSRDSPSCLTAITALTTIGFARTTARSSISIARRCIINRIQVPRILDIGGLKPWEVGHVDTMNLWSFGDRKAYTSLALLAHILGIPTPKDDITGADVARVYYEDKDLERIAAYCKKDVVATAQLYLRLTGRELIAEERIEMV